MTAIMLDLPLDAAVARRSLVPQAAAAVGGVLQPEPRRQRRAEDDGDHRRRAVRGAATSSTFYIPFWVVLAAHAAIGLGTLAGGWRIIHTMGSKITKLQPVGGFAAETGAAIALLIATQYRRAGQHDARDHRRDRRRRRDAAAVGGALGRRRADRLGVGADDSRRVRDRRGDLHAAPPRRREVTAGLKACDYLFAAVVVAGLRSCSCRYRADRADRRFDAQADRPRRSTRR